METEKLKKIFAAFAASGTFISASPGDSDRISDSYHITANEEAEYILQCVHSGIFTHIPEMIRNKEMVSGHIRNKLIKQRIHDITRKYITYFHTYRQKPYYKDHEGNYWTLSLFIKGARNYYSVKNPEIAYEVGAGLGEFENRVCDFDPKLLKETVPFYQDIPSIKKELENAVSTASTEKKEKCGEMITSLQKFEPEMLAFQEAKDEDLFPVRVTHNNFKVNNLLLDWNDKPLCVLDLDLVMPGVLHYDFGDAVRSVCNPAGEENINPEKVGFNLEHFRYFTDGFMGKAQHLLTRKEREYLPLSCKVMPYIQTLRLLTDYLKNDRQTAGQAEKTLKRAKCQFRLLQLIEQHYPEIKPSF